MKHLVRYSTLATMLCLMIACTHLGASTPATTTRLAGTVRDVATRQPVPDAYVYAYTGTVTHFFGPPAYLSAPTGPDGTYSIELPAERIPCSSGSGRREATRGRWRRTICSRTPPASG